MILGRGLSLWGDRIGASWGELQFALTIRSRPSCTDFESFFGRFKAVGKPGGLNDAIVVMLLWCNSPKIIQHALLLQNLLLMGNPVAKNLEFPFLSFVKIGKMNDCGTLQIQCVRNY